MSTYPPTGPYSPSQPATAPPPYYAPIPGSPGPYPHPASPGWPVPQPGYAYVQPAAPDPLPTPGTQYHQFLRTGRNRWWKGLLAIVAMIAGYLVVATALALIATTIDVATGRVDAADLQAGRIQVTPLVLLATNLTNAALIPLAMLLQWALWGQPVRWLHSVRGYFRWDVLKRTSLVVVPVFVVYVLASIFLFPAPPSGPFTAESVALLIIVLSTTPLQAAGEEYGTRGLITRAAGSWAAHPGVAFGIGTAVSATVFCLAHGAGDSWLIFYYFFFGVAMSVVVWRTGGLEIATLIHTVNNLLLFAVAIAMGQDLAAGLERGEGSGGPWILIPVVLLSAVTAYVWWWAKRDRVDRTHRPVR